MRRCNALPRLEFLRPPRLLLGREEIHVGVDQDHRGQARIAPARRLA
jgi:hypothetical protein